MSIIFIAGVLPALILLYFIYKQDRIEKEPFGLLAKLFIAGGLMTIPAGIAESVFIPIASRILAPTGSVTLFLLVENFLIIALAEEGFKRLAMRGLTWRHPAFNFRFDGVVYGVAAALGFAAFENVMYILGYGLGVAPVRAVTAIPLHCIAGVFMGHYYGIAKVADVYHDYAVRGRMLRRSILIPVIIHGAYDFIATSENEILICLFFVYIVLLDITAIRSLRRYSKNDVRMY